jgi:hypothetical protein
MKVSLENNFNVNFSCTLHLLKICRNRSSTLHSVLVPMMLILHVIFIFRVLNVCLQVLGNISPRSFLDMDSSFCPRCCIIYYSGLEPLLLCYVYNNLSNSNLENLWPGRDTWSPVSRYIILSVSVIDQIHPI